MRPTSIEVPEERFQLLRETVVNGHFPYRGVRLEGAVIDFAVNNGLTVLDAATTGDDRNMVEVRCAGNLSPDALSNRWTSWHLARQHSYHHVSRENGAAVLRFVNTGG